MDGCRPIPTYSREVRWDSQTDWRNVLPFLFSVQPSHSYTHRVRNGLTIAANVSTLFLMTHYFDREGRVCLLTCSHTAGTDDNLRRKASSRRPVRSWPMVKTAMVGPIYSSGTVKQRPLGPASEVGMTGSHATMLPPANTRRGRRRWDPRSRRQPLCRRATDPKAAGGGIGLSWSWGGGVAAGRANQQYRRRCGEGRGDGRPAAGKCWPSGSHSRPGWRVRSLPSQPGNRMQLKLPCR